MRQAPPPRPSPVSRERETKALSRLRGRVGWGCLVLALILLTTQARADNDTPAPALKLHIDYAGFNPLSLVLKDKQWVEQAVGAGVTVEWVRSSTTNRALDMLRTRSLDLGSSAGSTTLLQRANGNNVRIVYALSRPEWTALVVHGDSPIHGIQDLKGRRVSAIVHTEPGIFLLRALAEAGLTERDVTLVPMQDLDGRIATDLGQVDAWVGFDPFMAQAELETHDRLAFRKPGFNSMGVLDVRENFLAAHADIVQQVVGAYDKARHWAIDHRDDLVKLVSADEKISPAVAARQLERTGYSGLSLGDELHQSLSDIADTLKANDLVPADADMSKIVTDMVEPRFVQALPGGAED